jgi:septum site-determining protein MinC
MRETMGQDTPGVKMKGVGSGLWLTIAPDIPMEEIQAELLTLLKPLNLTSEARVTLDTGPVPEGEDSRSHADRYRRISNYLKDRFQLGNITAPDAKDSDTEKRYPMRSYRNIITQHRSDTLVLAGRVRSGQTVQAKKHLIIMGDVNPGCELIAGGDILVFGCLSGMAAAGQPNNSKAIILALEFRPTQVKIGDVVAAGLPPAGQGKPEFAHVEEGAIIVEDYLSANPFNRLPGPAIR